MATQITNDGASIRISNADGVLVLFKSQVRSIEVLQDTVCIVLWENVLKNIFIKFSDVTQPSGLANASALRDAVADMLDVGNKFEEQSLIELSAIKQSLVDIKNVLSASPSGQQSEPSRIDECNPQTSYFGYALPGADPSKSVWAIKRVNTRSNKMTITDWAGGHNRMEFAWDKRYELQYLPNKQ